MIKFEKNWKEIFAANGFTNEKDLYYFEGGEQVNENSNRNVFKFTMDVNGEEKTFFMKRFFNQHYKDIVSGFVNYGQIISLAGIEWKNARNLLKRGIETYHPVCMAVVEKNLRNMCSLFITEQIKGRCLADIIVESWADFSDKQKCRTIEKMAMLAAKAHKERISLPDLYVWHFYELDDDDSDQLAVIDLHRMKLRAGGGDFVKNIGGLHYSMTDEYFSDTEREYLLESYCKYRDIPAAKFKAKVYRRNKVLTSRRRRVHY